MMKSVIFIAMFLITLAYGSFTELEYRNTFTNWMIKHNKHYANHEFAGKYTTFKNNMDYVAEWNAKGSETRLGLNVMADLTNEEYQRVYLGTKFDASKLIKSNFAKKANLVESVDWRTKGAVTHIRNQGQCGGCWSFSAVGAVEGAHEIAGNSLVSLSEQQLIDCSTSYGNQGCNGGLMSLAFQYVINTGGLESEAEYPFTGQDGKCQFNKNKVAATISSYTNVTSGSESALASQINVGPVSVAIDASLSSFQLYDGGVYYDAQCSSTQLDHGVLAIGYGTGALPTGSSTDVSVASSEDLESSSSDWYIVKNSWGTSWGVDGFIYMARNQNNNCGIATMASQPQV